MGIVMTGQLVPNENPIEVNENGRRMKWNKDEEMGEEKRERKNV